LAAPSDTTSRHSATAFESGPTDGSSSIVHNALAGPKRCLHLAGRGQPGAIAAALRKKSRRVAVSRSPRATSSTPYTVSAIRTSSSAAMHAFAALQKQPRIAHTNRPSTEPQHERHAKALASAHPAVLNASAISLGAQASSAGSTSGMPSYWLSHAPSGPNRAKRRQAATGPKVGAASIVRSPESPIVKRTEDTRTRTSTRPRGNQACQGWTVPPSGLVSLPGKACPAGTIVMCEESEAGRWRPEPHTGAARARLRRAIAPSACGLLLLLAPPRRHLLAAFLRPHLSSLCV
jgi:hypothetical protein